MQEWDYNETPTFVRCSEELGLSEEVLEAIKNWAKTVGRVQTQKTKRYFSSPNDKFEIWVARIPDPDSNKGSRKGFRLVYFFILKEEAIHLDLIQQRKDQGGRKEHPKAQEKFSRYLRDLKQYLLGRLDSSSKS